MATVFNIENGRAPNPSKSTMAKLEKALGQSLADLQGVGEDGTPSVNQTIGELRLQDFNPYDEGDIPDGPGVYVLYDISDRPVYVGESGKVSRRIREHNDKFWFKSPIVESAAFIRIADSDLRRKIESVLIKFLKSNAVINKSKTDR